MTSRIKGPTEGPSRIEGLSGPEAVDAKREIAGAKSTQLDAIGAPADVDALDAASAVAQKLRAGEVTVAQAVELLIEDAIARQVGRALVGQDQLADELRTLLRSYATHDPGVLAKIRRLTFTK
jgi:hypothetical protein